METTVTINQTQKHNRSSIKYCITECWKVFAYEVKGFFKYLWLHLLVAGLGFALFTAEISTIFTEYIQPTQAYIASGYDPTLAKALFSPSWSTWLTAIVAFVAFILALALMKGAIFSQIRFYKAMDHLPIAGPFTFMSAIKQDARKSFVFDLIFFGVLLLCSTLILLTASFTSWWVSSLLLPIWLYGMVIGYNGRLQYIIENKSLKTVWKDAFKLGHHKLGGYLILLLLTGIPVLVTTYLVLQPLAVFQLAFSADMVSHLAGDPSGIPPYVMPVYIIVSTVGFFIFTIAFALQQWVLALYTSAFCNKKEIQESAE